MKLEQGQLVQQCLKLIMLLTLIRVKTFTVKIIICRKDFFGEPASIVAAASQDATITGPTAAIKPIVGDALTSEELTSNGLSTAPKCLSTADNTKKKSVWQYGVYDLQGSEYTGATDTKKAPFPIYDVAGTKELRGYASHWGVHVDYEVTDAEALAADWKNEQDATDTDIYKLFKAMESYKNIPIHFSHLMKYIKLESDFILDMQIQILRELSLQT